MHGNLPFFRASQKRCHAQRLLSSQTLHKRHDVLVEESIGFGFWQLETQKKHFQKFFISIKILQKSFIGIIEIISCILHLFDIFIIFFQLPVNSNINSTVSSVTYELNINNFEIFCIIGDFSLVLIQQYCFKLFKVVLNRSSN